MFLEIERAAQQELISVADFVRAALLEKLERSETKIRPNNNELEFQAGLGLRHHTRYALNHRAPCVNATE